MVAPAFVVGGFAIGPGSVGLMAVLNVTPDSFSDGGRLSGAEEAVRQGLVLARSADLVDVGGESTRPGAQPVDAVTELDRVLPVIRGLVAHGVRVSIDTQKAEVADAACAAGAVLVNDVGGLRDPALAQVAARYGASVCAMHMQGVPATMQSDPSYDDVVADVIASLRRARQVALDAGVPPHHVLVDPGIGFGKRLEHNVALLKAVQTLEQTTQAAVLVGPSRKAFLGVLTGQPVHERDWATAGAVAACVFHGARVIRVHHVSAMRDVVQVALALRP